MDLTVISITIKGSHRHFNHHKRISPSRKKPKKLIILSRIIKNRVISTVWKLMKLRSMRRGCDKEGIFCNNLKCFDGNNCGKKLPGIYFLRNYGRIEVLMLFLWQQIDEKKIRRKHDACSNYCSFLWPSERISSREKTVFHLYIIVFLFDCRPQQPQVVLLKKSKQIPKTKMASLPPTRMS